ncbi:unnamed protein product [Amoebophrya sp. A120]|nr:unnamed protein product [Amoebophrya sp. A120]|eukprot:GSA120T00015461001.1
MRPPTKMSSTTSTTPAIDWAEELASIKAAKRTLGAARGGGSAGGPSSSSTTTTFTSVPTAAALASPRPPVLPLPPTGAATTSTTPSSFFSDGRYNYVTERTEDKRSTSPGAFSLSVAHRRSLAATKTTRSSFPKTKTPEGMRTDAHRDSAQQSSQHKKGAATRAEDRGCSLWSAASPSNLPRTSWDAEDQDQENVVADHLCPDLQNKNEGDLWAALDDSDDTGALGAAQHEESGSDTSPRCAVLSHGTWRAEAQSLCRPTTHTGAAIARATQGQHRNTSRRKRNVGIKMRQNDRYTLTSSSQNEDSAATAQHLSAKEILANPEENQMRKRMQLSLAEMADDWDAKRERLVAAAEKKRLRKALNRDERLSTGHIKELQSISMQENQNNGNKNSHDDDLRKNRGTPSKTGAPWSSEDIITRSSTRTTRSGAGAAPRRTLSVAETNLPGPERSDVQNNKYLGGGDTTPHGTRVQKILKEYETVAHRASRDGEETDMLNDPWCGDPSSAVEMVDKLEVLEDQHGRRWNKSNDFHMLKNHQHGPCGRFLFPGGEGEVSASPTEQAPRLSELVLVHDPVAAAPRTREDFETLVTTTKAAPSDAVVASASSRSSKLRIVSEIERERTEIDLQLEMLQQQRRMKKQQGRSCSKTGPRGAVELHGAEDQKGCAVDAGATEPEQEAAEPWAPAPGAACSRPCTGNFHSPGPRLRLLDQQQREAIMGDQRGFDPELLREENRNDEAGAGGEAAGRAGTTFCSSLRRTTSGGNKQKMRADQEVVAEGEVVQQVRGGEDGNNTDSCNYTKSWDKGKANEMLTTRSSRLQPAPALEVGAAQREELDASRTSAEILRQLVFDVVPEVDANKGDAGAAGRDVDHEQHPSTHALDEDVDFLPHPPRTSSTSTSTAFAARHEDWLARAEGRGGTSNKHSGAAGRGEDEEGERSTEVEQRVVARRGERVEQVGDSEQVMILNRRSSGTDVEQAQREDDPYHLHSQQLCPASSEDSRPGSDETNLRSSNTRILAAEEPRAVDDLFSFNFERDVLQDDNFLSARHGNNHDTTRRGAAASTLISNTEGPRGRPLSAAAPRASGTRTASSRLRQPRTIMSLLQGNNTSWDGASRGPGSSTTGTTIPRAAASSASSSSRTDALLQQLNSNGNLEEARPATAPQQLQRHGAPGGLGRFPAATSSTSGATSVLTSTLRKLQSWTKARVLYTTQECTICLEPMCRGDRVTTLPCGNGKHAFHAECIQDWVLQKMKCSEGREGGRGGGHHDHGTSNPSSLPFCPLCKERI